MITLKRTTAIRGKISRSTGFLLILTSILFSQRIDFSQKPFNAERSRDYDARHYIIRISLDIPGKSFRGETTVVAASLGDGLTECVLDAESFTVTGVRSDRGEPLAFTQDEKTLKVGLPRAQADGEVFSFTVSYRGKEPKDGLRFYEQTADHPALVASDSWPYGVHHWFPCYDYPNDKATNEIIATAAAENKICANGRLLDVGENPAEGTVTYHWIQEKPHSTYLVFLACAPYVVVRDSCGTVPVNYWVYPQHEKDALQTYGKTPRMMKFFNELFDYDYPWAKYDQISVPFGGGMECTSATSMTDRIIHDERAEKDYSSIGIVSHELSHQWWGDLITLRTWAHAWMNEGFGTYCDYLYYDYDRGEDEGAVNLLDKKNSYLREARTRYIRPIVCDRYDRPQDLFDSHSYPKGAVVLHMMRDILGDKAFFKTLSHFLHEHEFDVVDTHDLQVAVKTVTGRNLDWFFDQWVYKPGHPVFEIGTSYSAETRELRLTVEQTQDTAQGVPVFTVPVDIGIVTAAGRRTERVWIRKKAEEFVFEVDRKPLLVRFDERNAVLKEWTFPKSPEELVFQLGHDDVIGRMWAVSELLKFKDRPECVKAVADAARGDEFWAVRRAAVAALAQIGDKSLVRLFREKAADPDSKVRVAAFNALGELRDASLTGFIEGRFRADDSYAAQAAALTAIGRCGDPSRIPFLKTAAGMPSYRNVIKSAAERALKELGGKE
jgi:aminopeptidase N